MSSSSYVQDMPSAEALPMGPRAVNGQPTGLGRCTGGREGTRPLPGLAEAWAVQAGAREGCKGHGLSLTLPLAHQ